MAEALQTIISLLAACTCFNFAAALCCTALVIIEFKKFKK